LERSVFASLPISLRENVMSLLAYLGGVMAILLSFGTFGYLALAPERHPHYAAVSPPPKSVRREVAPLPDELETTGSTVRDALPQPAARESQAAMEPVALAAPQDVKKIDRAEPVRANVPRKRTAVKQKKKRQVARRGYWRNAPRSYSERYWGAETKYFVKRDWQGWR
jgi:hypothetical protein